jgi:Cys-tRNA(Pro)/Cys-tRNA(Cys) deacylase
MADRTRAGSWLEEHGIPHREFRHRGNVTSVEQAARERGQRPEQVVRSLVFRIAANEFVMVLVAGTGQISWKKLRDYVGQRRLTLATPDEVFAATGYRIGTVSPFGLATSPRMLMDAGVLRQQEVSLGSGEAGTGIIMTAADLQRALPETEEVELVDIA